MKKHHQSASFLCINAFALAAIFLLNTALFAQTSAPERGFNPGKSYSISDIETISMQSGNLMLNVPLASLPPGRGGMSASIGMHYNSKLWDSLMAGAEEHPRKLLNLSKEGGWRYNYAYRLVVDPAPVILDGQYEAFPVKFSVILPDGSKHKLLAPGYTDGDGLSISPDGRGIGEPPTFPIAFSTSDGTFLRLEMQYDGNGEWEDNPWTLYLPDGSRVIGNPTAVAPSPVQQHCDRNGNCVRIIEKQADSDYSNRRTTSLIDALDRKLVIEYDYATNPTNGTSEDRIHSKGVNGASIVTRLLWKKAGINRTYNSCQYPLAQGCQNQMINRQIPVVDKIYLPEQIDGNLYYEFQYGNDWKEVSEVRLPSGAKSQYTFGGRHGVDADAVLRSRVTQKQLIYEEEHDGSTTTKTETSVYGVTYYNGTDVEHIVSSSITGPNGGVTTEHYYPDETVKIEQPDGSLVERVYAGNVPYSVLPASTTNRYVKYEFTLIADAAGSPIKTAIKEYSQDKNGNTTEVREYDFIDYYLIPRDSAGHPSGLPSGITPARITMTEFYNDTPDASSTNYSDADSYHLVSSEKLLRLAKSSEVQDGTGTPKSRSEISYDYTNYDSSNTKAGNPTETKAWDSFKGGAARAYSNPLTTTNSISTSATYNAYGMPLTSTDANGTASQISYGSINGYSDLYPTQTVTAYGTPIARTSSAVYDFHTGLATTATDVDNNVSVVTEYDAIGRPTKVRNAANTPLESWTRTEYNDAARRVIVRSDLDTIGDGKKVAIQHYDQLGRVRLSRSLENAATEDPTNETHGIKVQTRYQTGNPNSYQLTSNPFRAATSTAATNEQSMGWTRSKSWNTGRHSEVETFSGSGLPAPWGSNSNTTGVVTTDIDANTTTVTDQTGKKRRSVSNSLGHLVRVDEPNETGLLDGGGVPVQSTSYTYDALNNLLTVVQGGQTRSFAYSSLSLMISDINPESGTVNYQFDANGNPSLKTDARGVSTHFVYDALNRVAQKSYSGESGYTTPSVNYTYDEGANAKGRLTKINNGLSENRYTSFDKMGHVLASQQITDGQTYPSEYVYNLGGALVEQTYPSGRKVKNILDISGDLSIVQSRKNTNHGFFNFAKNFTYTASGAVSSMQLGNGQWQSTQYNPKLQPTEIAHGTTQNATNLLKLDFGYGTTQNNGTLQSQTITVPTAGTNPGFSATQTYTYDSLNRVKSATETVSGTQTWKQTFIFDRFGNRNFDEANSTTLPKLCGGEVCSSDRKIYNPSVNEGNNRLSASGDYAYDNAGNTTGNAQGHTFKYDAENKQVEVKNSAQQIIGQYFFDGGGKRVKKVVPNTSETTIFVYDSTGKMVAEYSTQISQVQQVSYVTSDHLGSPRIKTDQNGAVISRNDYHPYGEDVSTPQRTQGLGYKPDDTRQKFTGYERDNETGLDFAQARMYANRLGRFTTTDPSRKSIQASSPQTWNRFVYCYNNPLSLVDENGKWPTATHNFIIATAFDRMAPHRTAAIQAGSRRVDVEGGDVKTMKERNAPQHAMTPGAWVSKLGMEKAQANARSEAKEFVGSNLSAAKEVYEGRNRKGVSAHNSEIGALDKFGQGMHTVMDNRSPAHAGFQVFDGPSAAKTMAGAVVGSVFGPAGAIIGAAVGAGGISAAQHMQQESRPPTTDEMNVMVDEMRMAYRNTFGQQAYERDISEEQRRETEKRMQERNRGEMLAL